MLRFHLDEHIPLTVAQALRQHGVDVSTPVDAGLRGATDAVHLAFAHVESRVLVTHDRDFLQLHAATPAHSGIAYCRHDKYGVGTLLQMLLLLNACYGPEDMAGRVEFL